MDETELPPLSDEEWLPLPEGFWRHIPWSTALPELRRYVTQMAWPTGKQAEEEERTERHGGLFWIDQLEESSRLFLPNYFNTFREHLRRKPEYISLLRNRAVALGLLGRNAEAAEHEAEANEFSLA